MTAMLPVRTQRRHFPAEWTGDRLAGLDAVRRDRPGPDGVRAVDINLRWTWDDPATKSTGEAWALHDRTPGGRGNNWTHILDDEATEPRRMTRAESRRPVVAWATADVRRWRRPVARRGVRVWEQPATYEAMARYAVTVGVRIVAELKADEFALPVAARRLVASAHAAGHPPWFMALYGVLPKCRAKCKAVIGAGGQFAVIFGRWRARTVPLFNRRIRRWRPQPTRIWGRRTG